MTRRRGCSVPPVDLVERSFASAVSTQLRVADITYLRIWVGLLYLEAVGRTVSRRRVVGLAMSASIRADLVLSALGTAIECRVPAPDSANPSAAECARSTLGHPSSQPILLSGVTP